jgi:hypothetical protein
MVFGGREDFAKSPQSVIDNFFREQSSSRFTHHTDANHVRDVSSNQMIGVA